MPPSYAVSRRTFLQSATLASVGNILPVFPAPVLALRSDSSQIVQSPLEEFSYGEVALHSALHEEQMRQTHAVLMDLSDDALMRPFRMMAVDLPMKIRLEAVDPQHRDTVALVVGPVVLFAVGDGERKITRAQLMAAKKNGARSWQLETVSGVVKMVPFIGLGDEEYSTYLRVT